MNEGGRAKVDICNGTLHSGGTCPIIKVVSKGGYRDILVECTALVLRAWNYAMQTTEKLHTLGHSFSDEYFALFYGQGMSVTNWLASMAPRKKKWWATRWALRRARGRPHLSVGKYGVWEDFSTFKYKLWQESQHSFSRCPIEWGKRNVFLKT